MFIFYYYYKIEEEHQSEALFLEMKNYSFYFDDERFDMDILSQNNDTLYELMYDETSVYIVVPLDDSNADRLKVFYPIKEYVARLNEIQNRLYLQFFILTVIAFLIALLFSYYSLRPLRNALYLLEEFIKDIIHDLNTPISSIRLNLKMMQEDKRSQSIEKSVQSIAMLHKNLDSYLRERPLVKESLFLKDVVYDQVAFFKPLYDYLDWKIEVDESMVYSDRHALSRIVYNIISNACKYNTLEGSIVIEIKKNHITIKNNSYGVKDPSKVFKRFYKESERGLGIGLHIVEKFTTQLEIKKSFIVEDNCVIVTLQMP